MHARGSLFCGLGGVRCASERAEQVINMFRKYTCISLLLISLIHAPSLADVVQVPYSMQGAFAIAMGVTSLLLACVDFPMLYRNPI